MTRLSGLPLLGQTAFQGFVDQARIALAGHGFHRLANEEPEQLILA